MIHHNTDIMPNVRQRQDMSTGYKHELGRRKKKKGPLADVMQSEVTARTSLHPELKRNHQSSSLLRGGKKKIPSSQPNWQLLMEEEDYKRVLALMELLSSPPISLFLLWEGGSTKTRATSDTLCRKDFWAWCQTWAPSQHLDASEALGKTHRILRDGFRFHPFVFSKCQVARSDE